MKRGIALLAALAMLWAGAAMAEDVTMIVTASHLNGRARPSKKATKEALFDRGDVVTAVGWSDNGHWIEVKGGETGTVWCWWEYLTEQEEEYTAWWNSSGKQVKIRKEPRGTVIGYLKPEGEILVDRVLFGWGHCAKGWVNLEYMTEED